jgi:hypothetical protein
MHAAMELAADYPEDHQNWHRSSNYIIVLVKPNERSLWEFSKSLKAQGFKVSEFYEPDVQELTSIAVVSAPGIKEACKGIPLAGKNHHKTHVQKTLQSRERRLQNTISAMMECKNSVGQSVLEHGESVRDHLFDLVQFLKVPESHSKYSWKYPGWLFQYTDKILYNLMDNFTMNKYALLHDIGKPSCRSIDEFGKAHYPEHHKRSHEVFMSLYPHEPVVGELILRDMDLHLMDLKSVEDYHSRALEDYKGDLSYTNKIITTLLLTSLAEIHANAELFGGFDSESFKIKHKKLTKVGKALCEKMFMG